jgi:hypothetical protein
MSTHNVTVDGCLVLVLAGLFLELSATRFRRIPSLGLVFTGIRPTRTGRAGVLVAWTWAGLHFFAR